MTDFLCKDSSLNYDYCSDGALLESRLFFMEVRGRPQRPLEGERVVFLLSFGGFLVKRSFEDAIDCSGTIEVWV